jgi:hypothetical protein
VVNRSSLDRSSVVDTALEGEEKLWGKGSASRLGPFALALIDVV